jgi:hypothetical protein
VVQRVGFVLYGVWGLVCDCVGYREGGLYCTGSGGLGVMVCGTESGVCTVRGVVYCV